jgi:cell shape-determining protein MreC
MYINIRVSVKDVFYIISKPLFYPIKLLDIMGEEFNNIYDVYGKNKSLLKNNIELQTKYIDYISIKKENEELKKMLKFKGLINNNYNITFAKTYYNKNNILVVDVGLNDGIKEGDIVLSMNKVIVGRVVYVSHNHAEILLLSNAKSRIVVRTLDKEEFIVGGNETNYLNILYKQNLNTIIDDESLVFSREPDGFLVGIMRKKSENEYYVELSQDINKINNIIIITEK